MKQLAKPSSGVDDEEIVARRAFRYLVWHVIGIILISCFAFVINVGLVYALYSETAQYFVREAYSKQLGQSILLVGPFLLLFPEWLLFDILVTPFRQKH